ncbi:hypothetical protein NTH58_004348 [Enterobacter oligotrophicus]|nr:hypothetical protein [Enterobacter oligotrophicus]
MMFRKNLIFLATVLLIVGCNSSLVASSGQRNDAIPEKKSTLSYGIVTGVRYLTIHNDIDSNITGTISGAILGGMAGNIIGGEHYLIMAGTATGILAGQALQNRLTRRNIVELFIRPDDGRDFVTVQPTGRDIFFVGQDVNITYQRGTIIISARE